jgi:hypothetical protein
MRIAVEIATGSPALAWPLLVTALVDDPTALSMAGVLARQMGLKESSVRRAKMRS